MGAIAGTATAAPRPGVAIRGVPGMPRTVGAPQGMPGAVAGVPGVPDAVGAEPDGAAAMDGDAGAGAVDESATEAGMVEPSLVVAPTPVGGGGHPSARNKPLELVWHYLFRIPIGAFEAARNAREHSGTLDWSSDGCSRSPDHPAGFNFLPSCQRHDFGYRNYKRLQVFNASTRKVIDDHLKQDLYNYCNQFHGILGASKGVACRRIADTYYAAVREFGGP